MVAAGPVGRAWPASNTKRAAARTRTATKASADATASCSRRRRRAWGHRPERRGGRRRRRCPVRSRDPDGGGDRWLRWPRCRTGPGRTDPQRLQHVVRRPEALTRIGGQRARRDVTPGRCEAVGGSHFCAESLPAQGLHHDRADRVHVGLHRGRAARSSLRGQVARGAQNDPRHRHVVAHVRPDVEALGDAEVADLRVPILLQQDVARLDVPVQHPTPVCRGQCSECLGHDERHAPGRQGPTEHDLVPQRATRQAFHHEVRGRIVFTEVQHGDNVGMDEPGGDQRFLLEALSHARQSPGFGPQDLDRHRALEPLVEGVEDSGHAALPQQAADPVAAPDQRRGARLHPSCLPAGPAR